MSNLITTHEAAKHLNVSSATLRRWRLEGNGPKYIKLNRAVRYDPVIIANYLEGRLRASTSEGA